MHIIFSILINLANLEQNLKSGGTIANPANPAKKIYLEIFIKMAKILCCDIKIALN